MASMYAEIFRELQPRHDPRLIEAVVRLQYGTLDHLDRTTLREEAAVAAEFIEIDPAAAEGLAQSYGL